MTSILPKSYDFFSGFEKVGALTLSASSELKKMFKDYSTCDEQVKVIKKFEEEADAITYESLERLNRTFITPLDREDVHGLVSALDDVLDFIYACAERAVVFQLTRIPDDINQLAGTLHECILVLCDAISAMRDTKDRGKVLDACHQVHILENKGDQILRSGLRKLFSDEKDPIELIRIKETLENLETATDACESAANVIQGIMLKRA